MPVGASIGIAGVAGAAANLIGGQQQAAATKTAAETQADALNSATAEQQAQYQQTRSDLLPYNTAGQTATNSLVAQLPSLTAPITMDEATLRNTPGYQFNLNQGEKSVENSAAARGLGASGAALKGAATYASGLADSTYQNQFANANTNKINTYNILTGTANMGENAAAQTGAYGTQTANQIGANTVNTGTGIAESQTAGGAATAGGITGAANSLVGSLNNYGGYQLANSLVSRGLYGGGVPATGYGGGPY